MDKFDILLQKNPTTVPVREGLARDTLKIIVQSKRIRLARRILFGLFAVSLLLLLAKWLSNDIIYLVSLVVRKFAIVKGQGLLYWEALFESLPKPQILTVMATGILWYAWTRFETFIEKGRITNRGQKFIMKTLKMTPRLLTITVLLGVILIGFSGYSYAQKAEQEKLKILKQRVNETGRTEFETNITCDSADPNFTNLYEIKKDAKLGVEDAKKLIEASCIMDNSYEFASKIIRKLRLSLRIDSPYEPVKPKNGDTFEEISSGLFYKIKTIQKGNLELIDVNPEVKDPVILKLDPSAKIYRLKIESPQNNTELKEGMIIMPITLDTNIFKQVSYSKDGAVGWNADLKHTKALAIVILPNDLDIKWYDPHLNNFITRIRTCGGNPKDHCSFTGSIDLFPSGGGEGNSVNPKFEQNPKSCMTSDFKKSSNSANPDCRWAKDIAGVLTEINEKYVKIKSSSGRIFTINFDSDPVGEFNKKRAQNYENKQIVLGDTVMVSYAEADNKHSTTIENNQIFHAELMLEVNMKADPLKKY